MSNNKINLALTAKRTIDRSSRAVADTTLYGSGSACRRRSCAYCGIIVATSSGAYPETQRSFRLALEHRAVCETRAKYKTAGAIGALIEMLTTPDGETSYVSRCGGLVSA